MYTHTIVVFVLGPGCWVAAASWANFFGGLPCTPGLHNKIPA